MMKSSLQSCEVELLFNFFNGELISWELGPLGKRFEPKGLRVGTVILRQNLEVCQSLVYRASLLRSAASNSYMGSNPITSAKCSKGFENLLKKQFTKPEVEDIIQLHLQQTIFNNLFLF